MAQRTEMPADERECPTKLGFFDSGYGGLYIMRAVQSVLPEYAYVFYGDTQNVPYGDKEEEEIYAYTKRGVEVLFRAGALIVILACNSASAETLRRLQDTFLLDAHPDRRILGVIIPTIEEIQAQQCERPLLIGTKRTIASGKYEQELAKIVDNRIVLTSVATPELVPLIERHEVTAAVRSITPILDAHQRRGGDSVILGCTHYTALTPDIRARYPRMCIISQDELIPRKLAAYLEKHPELDKQLMRCTLTRIEKYIHTS